MQHCFKADSQQMARRARYYKKVFKDYIFILHKIFNALNLFSIISTIFKIITCSILFYNVGRANFYFIIIISR